MHVAELDTPVAVVDLDRLETNITGFQAYLDRHGIANRPHIKTHKIPQIAQMQIAAGAVGITCQKIGEAEVMADAGVEDIFIPYNILGSQKLARLAALANGVTIEGVRYGAIEASMDRQQRSNAWLDIALGEGKNREVRRVLAHLDLPVVRLIRVAFGPFHLGELERGHVEEIPTQAMESLLGVKRQARKQGWAKPKPRGR